MENLTAYEDSLLTLRELENANGVLSVYICYMDKETGRAVYIADGTVGEERRPTGTYVAIEQRNLDLIGQGIYDLPAYITKRKGGGWLCSASSGIYDKEGRLIANHFPELCIIPFLLRFRKLLEIRRLPFRLETFAVNPHCLFRYQLYLFPIQHKSLRLCQIHGNSPVMLIHIIRINAVTCRSCRNRQYNADKQQTASEFEKSLLEMLESTDHLQIDMEKVVYVSSAGLFLT